MEGHTLADGLTEFPRVFPEIYRATVSAGEQAGHLDDVLERLADYTESREQMRQKILAAMLYPIVLTVMCFVIVSALLVFVVPKVVSVFQSSKAQLPLITRVLIGTSGFLRVYGIWLVILAIIAAVLFQRWLRNPGRPAPVPPAAASPAARGQAGARLQHGALHAHVQHPLVGARCRCSKPCASPARW